MKLILGQLKAAFFQLFATPKHRTILIVFVLLAALVSVSELAIAKLFGHIILAEETLPKSQLIIYIGSFLLLFIVVRTAHFVQRIYRVNVFDNAFKETNLELKKRKMLWRWKLAFELTTILSKLTSLVVVVVFLTILNWRFGIINIIVIVVILQIFGRLFKKQLKVQRKFVKARIEKMHVPHAIRFGARIRSGELGNLISGIAMLILMVALLGLGISGSIKAANTIVLFFGIRMQNSNLSAIAIGLMRFAKAKIRSV